MVVVGGGGDALSLSLSGRSIGQGGCADVVNSEGEALMNGLGESEERVNGHAIGDDDYDKDFRDSPWTIEALDDEPEVKEEVRVRS